MLLHNLYKNLATFKLKTVCVVLVAWMLCGIFNVSNPDESESMKDIGTTDRKRQLSNARRLESLKSWKLGKSLQAKQIKDSIQNLDSGHGFLNKKIKFDSDISEDENVQDSVKHKEKEQNQNAKPSLFASSESEGEDNEVDDKKRFKIKSQFQGQKGQQLFEMSSHFTDDRFRLDERFKEIDESDVPVEEENESLENCDLIEERKKNFEILEQVLGFQVPKKQLDIEVGTARKKRYVRFDPESKDALKYMKNDETTEDIPNTKSNTKKKEAKSPSPVREPEISTDRYFEVSSDLKDILRSSSDFSLSRHFGFVSNVDNTNFESSAKLDAEKNMENTSSFETRKDLNGKASYKRKSAMEISSSQNTAVESSFFFSPHDSRLQEGVDFFRRKKPMDEIREEWMKNRDAVMEIFRRKRKLSMKATIPKVRKGTSKKKIFSYKRK